MRGSAATRQRYAGTNERRRYEDAQQNYERAEITTHNQPSEYGTPIRFWPAREGYRAPVQRSLKQTIVDATHACGDELGD